MNVLVEARRIRVTGVVQGVGFRPFVYQLADQHDLSGWVLNDDAGVEIHIEGPPDSLDRFFVAVREYHPPAARIADISCKPVDVTACCEFQIRASRTNREPTTRISPDLAVCESCLRELFDDGNVRQGYPYINCTHCGPRYSIVCRLPYDRENTTMAQWPLCESCEEEYKTPSDRRFHAQPTCCPKCGPRYRLEFMNHLLESTPHLEVERPSAPHLHYKLTGDAVEQAAELLRRGSIVAVKGVGGYHLACDAQNADAVRQLRDRKYRKEKPFALMVRDLTLARQLVELTPAHEELLTSVARPIVLATAKKCLPGVAPDNRELGVMLPYAPLHHLLFHHDAPDVLVLTSANRSSEPIAYRDDDARERLSSLADALLVGERPIARRVDDSVVALRDQQPLLIRRSRGYAPDVVARLPCGRPILALGADLKNSVALVVDGQVLMSPYIGDLGDVETDQAFQLTIRDLLAMYDLNPRDVTLVHDLHPEFVSRRLASCLQVRATHAVQHHEAHLASVMAEHAMLDQPVIGLVMDGTGWGHDGTIWGFEFFHGSVQDGFERCGHMKPVPMPGGDAAARNPIQAAAGFLANESDLPDLRLPPFSFTERYAQSCQLVTKGIRCHTSTSAGRLFDAAAALLGFTRSATFEGQAAIWLENQCDQTETSQYAFDDLDARLLLRQVVKDRLAGRPVAEIARALHGGIASEVAASVRTIVKHHPAQYVAVSGGVFQNRLLWELFCDEIRCSTNLRVLRNHSVPANDGGIALGQAALASFRCLD